MRRPINPSGSTSRQQFLCVVVACLGLPAASVRAADDPGPPLPGTKPLTMTGDIASELVAGVDRFLLKQIDESTAKREKYWKRDLSSHAAYNASVEPNRKRLAHILGVRDQRVRVAGGRRSTRETVPGGFRFSRERTTLSRSST